MPDPSPHLLVGHSDSDGFERRVTFSKAWEKRHDDPAKDYGVGSVGVWFALVGSEGAVSFHLSSGWYLPHVRERFKREGHRGDPCAGPVVWHHPTQREDYFAGPDECELLPGGKCWGDAGYLLGNDAYDALCEGGEDGLWVFLRRMYDQGFAPSEDA